jgi:hypothetical protein
MQKSASDTSLETHFKFGENWQSFAAGIDEAAIEQATAGLLKLVDANRIRGARMIDIGGSVLP